jgi:CRISPR-associated endoribonuclease Cas6
MPTRWQVLLQPQDASRTTAVPPAQLHGLACNIFERAGADHTAQVKPFAVKPLVAAPDAPGCALLQIGWLNDHAPPNLTTLSGHEVRLGSQYFTVLDAQGEHVPYRALARTPSATSAELTFRSVTYFSRGDRQIPLPDPELVFTSLARRWNTFAPDGADFRSVTIEALLGSVRLNEHRIESSQVDQGKAMRVGFLGKARFGLARAADQAVERAFATLAVFAETAGIGAQTTHGLGWVSVELGAEPGRRRDPPRVGALGAADRRNRAHHPRATDGSQRATHLPRSEGHRGER